MNTFVVITFTWNSIKKMQGCLYIYVHTHTHTHTNTYTYVFVSVKVNENILHKIRNTQKSLRYVGLCLMDYCEYMKAQNYLHANHS